jgi:hypothetical protein
MHQMARERGLAKHAYMEIVGEPELGLTPGPVGGDSQSQDKREVCTKYQSIPTILEKMEKR